jgi:hypothetical protein
MSFHSQNFDRAPVEKVEVEVILIEKAEKSLLVKLDETSRSIRIPRHGVKVKSLPTGYAVLTLSEDKAITYNLV